MASRTRARKTAASGRTGGTPSAAGEDEDTMFTQPSTSQVERSLEKLRSAWIDQKTAEVVESVLDQKKIPIRRGRKRSHWGSQATPFSKSSQQQPSLPTPEKDCEGVRREPGVGNSPSPVNKLRRFLKKGQDSGHSTAKATKLTLMKARPALPELEDEFRILENNVPIDVSIPTKSNRKQETSKKSSSYEGSSMDGGSKDNRQDLPSRKTVKELMDCKKNKRNEPMLDSDTSLPKNQLYPHQAAADRPKEGDGGPTDGRIVRRSSRIKKALKAVGDPPKSGKLDAKVKRMKARHCDRANGDLPSPSDFDLRNLSPTSGGTFQQNRQSSHCGPSNERWRATSILKDAKADPLHLLNPAHKRSNLGKETKAPRSRDPPESEGGAVGQLLGRRAARVPKTLESSGDRFSCLNLSSNKESAHSDDVPLKVCIPDNLNRTFIVDGGRASPESFGPSRNILQTRPMCTIDLELSDDADLSSTEQPWTELSLSDLCAPPLKPFTLQAQDVAKLTEWLGFLFPTTLKGKKNQNFAEVSPGQFNWYCHKSGVMGIAEDLHFATFSEGKMLLCSFMKKPLWVDDSSSAIFFLLTSSIRVIVDNMKSCLHAGDSFMVPCGHAYSIENLTAEPAALCFNRIVTESPY